MQIATTERLILRTFQVEDAAFLFALNSNPNVLQFTGDIPFTSVDNAKTFIENYTDYQRNYMGRWLVVLKDTNEPIGWCGLKKHTTFVDLGFRFLENYWNQGYASEAAKCCIDYGFAYLNLDKIVGRTMLNNIGSQKVLEKIGMQFSHKEWVDGLHEAKIYTIHNDKKRT